MKISFSPKFKVGDTVRALPENKRKHPKQTFMEEGTEFVVKTIGNNSYGVFVSSGSDSFATGGGGMYEHNLELAEPAELVDTSGGFFIPANKLPRVEATYPKRVGVIEVRGKLPSRTSEGQVARTYEEQAAKHMQAVYDNLALAKFYFERI